VIIQELKPSNRVSGRWLAVLEDNSILRLGECEVIDFALYAGKELSEEETELLLDCVRRSSLKEKALELLTRKPQSRRQLEKKLEEWGADEEETASICDRMETLGYLNDEAYAIMVVQHYANKGFGAKKLRDELYRRGVPRDLWESALEQADDPSSAIDAFVEKKLSGKDPDRKELEKVSAALLRRGFSWSEIRDALSRYRVQLDEFD